MRFMFKTDYEDDIRLFPHSGYVVSYGVLLALLAIAPFVFSSYIVSQLVFVCIYATVGVGLMILTGFTGQASLGHAAFLAIGAYTTAYLQQFNVPFPVYFIAAGLLTGIIGALVGFPALRLQGIYLVIATISFAFIVEEILARWESVTNGNEGMRVKTIQLLGTSVPRDSPAFYFLCLGVLILTIVGTLNLLRSPTGRAFVAIRDSETAARSMGVNVSLYKVKSFAISAGITGLAGCLFAHKLSFISPEMFTLQLSIEFIIVILIGGTFSLHGAVLGAIFIVMIDPFLTYLKDDVPGMVAGVAAAFGAGADRAAHIQNNVAAFASANGLKGAIYGVIIVLFVLFAHKLSFISPEMFTLQLSIEFIIVILIGGTFSLHGAVLGAIFLVMIDPFLTYLKDDVPGMVAGVAAAFGAGADRAAHIQNNVAAFASANGLKGAIYGVIIVLFVLFEPLGLYGRWLKIKLFFQLFPLYKRATFKRQKIYVKSERNR
ncbi:branched-chain amino acid ABC transporter permease [Bradyrhizobium sp.]|uniref:branched-chain amino acid ABC transporter permease n=1 Tax=Bradyrhizobium sp. TaxID=376 RepID=UPI003C7E6E3F